MESVLSPTDDVHHILPMISHRMHQLGLPHSDLPYKIFLKAFEEGVVLINAGQDIDDVPAFYRSKCFSVVREKRFGSRTILAQKQDHCKGLDLPGEEKTINRLLEAVQQLQAEDKELLILRLKGLTFQQISQRLDMSDNFVQKRFNEVRLSLRREFSHD